MPAESATPNRKRTRAQVVEEDLDELSPQKEKPRTPLSGSSKRRKTDSSASPATLGEGIASRVSRLSKKVSGLFGISNRSEKENHDTEDADELAAGEDAFDTESDKEDGTESGRGTPGAGAESQRKSGKNSREVLAPIPKPPKRPNSAIRNLEIDMRDGPAFDEEGEPVLGGSLRRRGREKTEQARSPLAPASKAADTVKDHETPKPRKKRTPSIQNLEIDMWDGPNSDEEREAGRGGRDKIERAKSLLASASKATDARKDYKRSPGRPRKSDILKKDQSISRKERRQRMSKGEQDDDHEMQDEETPKKRKRHRLNQEDAEDTAVEAADTSTSHRGKSKRETEILNSVKEPPKGILTPTKKKLGRPRKSVAFEQDLEMDLGFKDLPNSASGKKSNSKDTGFVVSIDTQKEPSPAAGDSNSDSESSKEIDDVACALCSKLNSRKGNQILLCDGCDFAGHQKCLGLPVIPEGDWYCQTCRPDIEEEEGVELESGDESTTEYPSHIPAIEGFEDHLRNTQRVLLDKLTGQKRIKLRGHDDQMQKVHQVLEQTVLAGEGNSMLVIGGRGSGKTTLVESAISDISTDHREQFHVVRLNGFIHTDDKVALREIWRQLGREMEVEDDLTGKTSNYADTLASLLALLSHPSEIPESQPEQTAKSVIFVLDEFDLFTTHARQTLLYNLFDIAQAKKAPIAVLGLTTRIDVVESLEKRVKSRFSHRYVYLSLPRSLPMFWEICRECLIIGTDEINEGSDTRTSDQEAFVSFWNLMIDDLYKKDSHFRTHLEAHFYQTKSVPAFFASGILPIANLSPKSFPLTGRMFSSTLSLSPPDSKLHILQGLSDLELALLIAAARLDIILDTDTCNFAMAYDEYCSLTSKHKIQTSSTGVTALGSSAKVWGSDVALGAWERLAEYELLVPAGIGGGGGRDFGIGGRMWKVDVGLEEITGSIDGLSGVMAKWCREI
ncbi:hypothetical protein G7Y89_g10707 [Cudoniella acicularis]|uniref:PHD-type domain-containing protein n=1 Tax=Cudoniella acicularis TaxID=354080 RepID=A0A8H4RDS3_9HELO|nr:hypothetical protein G7Y89_g10707 [Cudoniella acicularis]